jgi:hypothetical protein
MKQVLLYFLLGICLVFPLAATAADSDAPVLSISVPDIQPNCGPKVTKILSAMARTNLEKTIATSNVYNVRNHELLDKPGVEVPKADVLLMSTLIVSGQHVDSKSSGSENKEDTTPNSTFVVPSASKPPQRVVEFAKDKPFKVVILSRLINMENREVIGSVSSEATGDHWPGWPKEETVETEKLEDGALGVAVLAALNRLSDNLLHPAGKTQK